MKQNLMLTITSPLSILFMTFHLADDIVRGFEKGVVSDLAAARKLGIRLWIMLREEIDYHEFRRRGQMRRKTGGVCAGMPELRYGAKQSPTD